MASGKSSTSIQVAKVLSRDRVILNRGEVHGVKPGMRFVLYNVSEEEILDPATGESLGQLELIKGAGEAIHVQAKMCVVYNHTSEFPGAAVGDLAKPV